MLQRSIESATHSGRSRVQFIHPLKTSRFHHLVTLLISLAAADVGASECDRQEAYAAETVVDYLSSWDDVYRFFGQFQSCYDASIAEGVNDRIYKLLADKWDNLSAMLAFADSDPAFRDFMHQRIDDETFPEEEFSRVADHAKHKCPAQALDFCQAIIARAEALAHTK